MTQAKQTFFSLLFVLLLAGTAQADTLPRPQTWEFTATLDGKPIGTHVFTLAKEASGKKNWHLTGEASFVATFVGIPVYRYHHKVEESWDGDCLANLTADTNDDGDTSHVEADGSRNGGKVQITRSKNDNVPTASNWDGCLMDFAYWNPALLKQKQLLNSQTGEVETVIITQQPAQTAMVHGQQVEAEVWRVAGKHEPVDILYAPDGEWIGLNATVEGGYALAYRLQ